jgi:hypothetical protein
MIVEIILSLIILIIMVLAFIYPWIKGGDNKKEINPDLKPAKLIYDTPYHACINAGDENFYQCLIDAYEVNDILDRGFCKDQEGNQIYPPSCECLCSGIIADDNSVVGYQGASDYNKCMELCNKSIADYTLE